jgi:hypothetical protein
MYIQREYLNHFIISLFSSSHLKKNKIYINIIMQKLLNKLKAERKEHLVFVVLLIIYILLDIQLPTFLVNVVDTIYGKVILYLLALHVFLNVNKVAGVLAFVAAYTMIRRASMQRGTFAIRNYLPSEESKVMDFAKFNDYPYTLEEEEVSRMAPLVRNETSSGSDFKPVLDEIHNASPTNL